MAINVTFYTFAKRLNSTAQPSGGTTHACEIRSGSDKYAPNIEYRGTGFDITGANYMYIPTYGRYYYIEKCTYNAEENFWLVSGVVDVLATFRGSIHASGMKVARAYSDYDVTLADSLDVPQGEPLKIASFIGDSFMPILTSAFANSVVVLNIAGRGWVWMRGDDYNRMLHVFFAQNDPFDVGAYFTQDIAKNIVNPASYIISAHCLPIDSSAMPSSPSYVLYLGWYRVEGVGCHPIDNSLLQYTATTDASKHPQAEGMSDYLNFAPYTYRKLFLQGLGMVDIDSDNCITGGAVNILSKIDVCSGTVTVRIKNEFGLPIGYATGELAYPLSVYSRKSPDIISMASNVLIGGAVGGVMGALGGGAHAITSLGGSGSVSVHGTTGGVGSWTGNNESCLISIFRQVKRPDALTQGRPLYANRILGDLSGYVQVMNGCGDVICTGSESEKRQIKQFLEGGVYIE